MGQALYRKYRSKSFDEVIGQDHITKTLQSAIKSGRISHAYLFTGPRGVGKTSVARILAYAVNGLDYESEATHLDIIEIDAASNRRIDEIRELRDRVHVTPSMAKYKVYIIDEVHMLTREAFNALLKTLEEPPQHAIFILATTEAHKLPDTIISRTQRHNFKAVSSETVASHLADIAKAEGIKIDENSLKLLAQFGEGSFRDSISLLDQMASTSQNIDETVVRSHLGLPSDELTNQLLEAAANGDAKQVIDSIGQLRDQAADPAAIAKLLADKLRLEMSSGDLNRLSLMKSLIDVPAGLKPFDSLELALLETASQAQPRPSSRAETPMADKPAPRHEKLAETKAEIQDDKPTHKSPAASFDVSKWEDVLIEVKAKAPAVYTALRLASPRLEQDRLILAFEFGLHQKKVNQAANKEIVAAAVETIFGNGFILECIVDKAAPNTDRIQKEVVTKLVEVENDNPLQTISSIFGSAEMLES